MSAHLRRVGKYAGRFDNNLDTQLFPRQSSRIFLVKDGDTLAVDAHDPLADLDLAWKNSIGRVIAEQVCVCFQIGHVVDCDSRQVFLVVVEHRAQDQAADPAEAIDGDLCCHSSPVKCRRVILWLNTDNDRESVRGYKNAALKTPPERAGAISPRRENLLFPSGSCIRARLCRRVRRYPPGALGSYRWRYPSDC